MYREKLATFLAEKLNGGYFGGYSIVLRGDKEEGIRIETWKIINEKDFIAWVQECFMKEGLKIKPLTGDGTGFVAQGKEKEELLITITVSGGGCLNPEPPFYSFVTINPLES